MGMNILNGVGGVSGMGRGEGDHEKVEKEEKKGDGCTD